MGGEENSQRIRDPDAQRAVIGFCVAALETPGRSERFNRPCPVIPEHLVSDIGQTIPGALTAAGLRAKSCETEAKIRVQRARL